MGETNEFISSVVSGAPCPMCEEAELSPRVALDGICPCGTCDQAPLSGRVVTTKTKVNANASNFFSFGSITVLHELMETIWTNTLLGRCAGQLPEVRRKCPRFDKTRPYNCTTNKR